MKKVLSLMLTVIMLLSLTIPALAVAYTPSVEHKDGPEIVPDTPVVIDENGEEQPLDELVELVITPISQIDNAMLVEIQSSLNRADRQVRMVSNVGNLTPQMEVALQKLKDSTDDPLIKGLKIEDLVVCDLFDVSLVRNRSEVEYLAEGQMICFSLQTSLRPGDVFFLLYNPQGTEWEVVESCALDEDGILFVMLSGLGPLAIVVDTYHDAPVIGPTSPQTGYSDGTLGAAETGSVSAALYMLCGATVLLTFCAFYRRKRSENA